MTRFPLVFVMMGLAVLTAATASAQAVVGTFRWQLAPYCNVVTLTVVQNGPAFSLHGTDDQCGAPQFGAVTGSAHVNPDGTAGLAFTVTRPDGRTMPASATINLATLAGGWLDEWSTRGTFVFNPSSPSGSPRPILLQGFAQVQFRSTNTPLQAENAMVSFGRSMAALPILHIVTSGSVAECGGSVLNAVPNPGHLCFYELESVNVQAVSGDVARSGAVIEAVAAAQGVKITWRARWVLNVP